MAEESCPCLEAGARFDRFDRAFLGTDDLHGEASIWTCRTCGRTWLHYHLEFEWYTGSGRWYRGLIGPGTAVTAANAALVLGGLREYFAGGSRFGGTASTRSGPPDLSP